MEQRTFQFDGQWNIVYYPYRPSGFAIMIIGNNNHFVDEKSSYWLEHPGRKQIIKQLKSAGYTSFSSNLYGANWGNDKSVLFSAKLYHFIMKSEILNEHIHILAEGTGALTALKLFKELKGKIRSAVFINPCLSLKAYLEKEKEHKLYYYKLLSELTEAYEMDKDHIETSILTKEEIEEPLQVPLKIIHVLGNGEENQSHLYKKLGENRPEKSEFEIQYLIAEKRYKIPSQAHCFFKKFEENL